jgi:hypothetical protein
MSKGKVDPQSMIAGDAIVDGQPALEKSGLPLEATWCPKEYPFAIRPSHNWDWCCKTDKDQYGKKRNDLEDYLLRSETCFQNEIYRCNKTPCVDYDTINCKQWKCQEKPHFKRRPLPEDTCQFGRCEDYCCHDMTCLNAGDGPTDTEYKCKEITNRPFIPVPVGNCVNGDCEKHCCVPKTCFNAGNDRPGKNASKGALPSMWECEGNVNGIATSLKLKLPTDACVDGDCEKHCCEYRCDVTDGSSISSNYPCVCGSGATGVTCEKGEFCYKDLPKEGRLARCAPEGSNETQPEYYTSLMGKKSASAV